MEMIAETCFFKKNNDAFDSALLAANENSYIPYDGMDICQEGSTSLRLESVHNQERQLIKKDLFKILSPDAHYVTEAIIDELPELVTPKTGNITRRSISLFLRKKHWDKKRIKKTFVEIQGFVLQMADID
jgi:hypothetical protein